MPLPPHPAISDRAPSSPGGFTPKRVDGDILRMLESSALGGEFIDHLHLRIAKADELVAIGRKPVKAVVIPYFDLSGSEIDFCRYRYLEDPRSTWERMVTHTKAQRYFQAAGTGLHAYFAPIVDWMALSKDVTKPLLITEGEKKAACATAYGFPCIGLGGVDSFASKKEDAFLLPELLEFKWESRQVIIIYDSDASTNPNVLAAAVRLGRKLFALGADVRIASLPPTKEGGKQGIDDFIFNARVDAISVSKAVTAVIDAADATLFEREIALYDFNSQFVYIRDMDRVICRDDATILVPDAFMRRAYASSKHREWEIKTAKDGSTFRVAKLLPTAIAWMEWELRLTCRRLEFVPGGDELVSGAYNLWRGWPIKPEEGNVNLWTDLLDKLFTGSPRADRDWFERWCAYPFQNPGAKLKTACLLWSKMEGTGKSSVLECLRSVYKDLYVPMNDSAVDLQYTDWMVNRLMIGVDDIAAKNRDDHAAKWKNLITAPRLTIQKKYTPSFEIDSHVNFIMTSNEPNALRLSGTDRRYFIQRVAEWGTKDERSAFFSELYAWLDTTEGPKALMHHFLTLDMGTFDPDVPAPLTESKIAMQDLSKGALEQWIDNLKDAPDAILKTGSVLIPGDLWTSDDLAALYNSRPDTKTSVTRVTMGMAMTSAGIPQANNGVQVRLSSGLRVRPFAIRNPSKWVSCASPSAIRDHYETTRGKA